MYVITFYSFKGGVGRTMALVNVAAELVKRGRKVLVVDFDLEAPGLETYKHLRPDKPHPGIVEYVTEYRRSNQVPDFHDYIYQTKPIGKKGGELWVMPAGRRDADYRRALARLDWQRLYKDEEGFLLFEDTKAGWEIELKPDYVLIDSRTGDTDVLGICTRQLPDSVVLMFTPNEQNLAGLENVCRDIRREETEGLKKKIKMHFVAANVPDLDDERGVLRRQLRAFRERLEFEELSSVIRRYENLLLLDQSVFTLDRPRTRLAKSYRRLLRVLRKDNLADKLGANLVLRNYANKYSRNLIWDIRSEVKRRLGAQEARNYKLEKVWESDDWADENADENRLNQIAGHFLDDANIFAKVAQCWILKEEFDRAVQLLNRALKLQANHPQAYFLRAMCKKQLGDKDGAADDLCNHLHHGNLESEDVVAALRELRAVAPTRLPEAADFPAVKDLQPGELTAACDILADSEHGLEAAIQLQLRFFDKCDDTDGYWRSPLHSYLIRAGKWREVIEWLERQRPEQLTGADLFELAIAYWGETGSLRADLCRRALDMIEIDYPFFFRNVGGDWLLRYGVGLGREMLPLVDMAEVEVKQGRRRPFSIWRFREVTADEFLEDCQQLRRMFQGEPLRPAFLGPPTPASAAQVEAQ